MSHAVYPVNFSRCLFYGHATFGFVRTLTSSRRAFPAGIPGPGLHSVLGVKDRRLLTEGAFQMASANCGPRALSRLPRARSLASWRR